MRFVPIDLPAGVYANGTEYEARGRWNAASLVRWQNGGMGPVGGWRAWGTNTITGIARSAIPWVDNSGNRWIGLGTAAKLYVSDDDATFTDVTPVGFTTGNASSTSPTGYGKWTYGSSTYGTARPDFGGTTPATVWHLDTWGEDLVGCTADDGKLYQWDTSVGVGTVAAAITNAPTSCRGLVVTSERFLVALGASGNRRLVKWSDQEANTTWTAAAGNQAGSQELQTNGTIVAAVRVRGQTLILTDIDAHAMTYQGPPFIFGFEQVGTNCGLVAVGGITVADNVAYWAGQRGFWLYDGYTRPLRCDVLDTFLGQVSEPQISKLRAWHNQEFNEVWWFYPSETTSEVDKYISYNYHERHWSMGDIGRTAVADRGVFTFPVAFDSSGNPYEHEVGRDFGSETPFAESGPIEIGDGDRVLSATSLIPDEDTLGDVTVTVKTRFYPTDSDTSHGPYTMAAPTDVRFTGRQMRLRVTSNSANDWRWGVPRIEVRPGGRR